MIRILLAVAISTVYLASCQDIVGDKNDRWKKNELTLTNIVSLYSTLALYVDDVNNTAKRFCSIVSLASMYYAVSKKKKEVDKVREALAKTKRQLDQPADVIAIPLRSFLPILLRIIDEPINDVKKSCTPTTKQQECDKKLNEVQKEGIKKCKEYKTNINLYETTVKIANDPQLADFFTEFTSISPGSDSIALSFFSNSVLFEYQKLFQQFGVIYRALSSAKIPCDVTKVSKY